MYFSLGMQCATIKQRPYRKGRCICLHRPAVCCIWRCPAGSTWPRRRGILGPEGSRTRPPWPCWNDGPQPLLAAADPRGVYLQGDKEALAFLWQGQGRAAPPGRLHPGGAAGGDPGGGGGRPDPPGRGGGRGRPGRHGRNWPAPLPSRCATRPKPGCGLRPKSQGLYLTGRYSPGYGDWPIAVQPRLAAVLDTPRRIGLYVTDTFLMLPRKSVTAVLGAGRAPVSGQRAGCAHCALRDKCEYRKRGESCES